MPRTTAQTSQTKLEVFAGDGFLKVWRIWVWLTHPPRLLAQPEVGHLVPFALTRGNPRALVEALILEGLSD